MCDHKNIKQQNDYDDGFDSYDYDYDPDRTTRHHLQTCKDCGMWRFKTQVSDYTQSDTGHHYTKTGNWMEAEKHPENDHDFYNW
jgi:hypothetical protein